MEIMLNGREICSESAFHDAIDDVARAAGFTGYGRNLDALWDVLTAILPRPIEFHWINAAFSRQAIGPRFDKLVAVVEGAQRELGASVFRARVQL